MWLTRSQQQRLTKSLRIAPKYLGSGLDRTRRDQLIAEVEGTCIEGAFVIIVLGIISTSKVAGVCFTAVSARALIITAAVWPTTPGFTFDIVPVVM